MLFSHRPRFLHRSSRRSAPAAATSPAASSPAPPASPPISPTTTGPHITILSPPEGDWESRYKALKAERQAAAIARWEELQEQFPDVDFPSPDNAERPSKRVIAVVNKLFSITLMESYQLARLMDEVYGMTERGVGGAGGGGGGGGGGGAAAAPTAAPAAAAAEKKEEAAAPPKSAFTVRLDGFAAADKIKVIKEVRTATGLGLKESKELVEAAPKVVKKDLNKADCDALVAKLKEAGAKVTVE